jgi:peptide deformylase
MSKNLPIAQLGANVIRNVAEPVYDVSSPEIQTFIDDLLFTCNAAKGMGIAAPQVSVSKRIFVMSSEPNARYPHAPKMEPTVIINPQIISHRETMQKDWEGCLSLPGVRALVPRYSALHVSYTTREGETLSTHFEGFLARIFQHEFDHLEGTVFIDRVESTKDVVMEQEYQRMVAGHPAKAGC